MNLQQDTLLNAMLKPGFYPHPVEQLELIETHISLVILTGSYAYKIKKPVNFGFLDFSDLEQRGFYCKEEIRLNGRLAPDIYLDVIAITESQNGFELNGDGRIVEYAIRMKQFNPHDLMSKRISDNSLGLQHMDELAEIIANFHHNIQRLDSTSPLGTADEVIQPVKHNFEILKPIVNKTQLNLLAEIEQATLSLHQQLETVFNQRKQQGFIRECHGDLHLGNIALINDKPLPFDGIEFNQSLRWIDTMSEVAFLIMDLEDHQKHDYACEFLNPYLEISGDYAGLQLLRYYKIYRAMVRAKVTGLRLQQLSKDSDEYQHNIAELDNYLKLAKSYCHTTQAAIIINHGISGSGKSWLAMQIKNDINAIVIHSDRERKRLFADEDNLYSHNITEQVYSHLLNSAKNIIAAGYTALVDATFLNPEYRQQFKQAADKLGATFYILNCTADEQTLEKRIQQRIQEKNCISDADINIMHKQLEHYQPLTEEEQGYTINIETGGEIDFEKLVRLLKPKKH